MKAEAIGVNAESTAIVECARGLPHVVKAHYYALQECYVWLTRRLSSVTSGQVSSSHPWACGSASLCHHEADAASLYVVCNGAKATLPLTSRNMTFSRWLTSGPPHQESMKTGGGQKSARTLTAKCCCADRDPRGGRVPGRPGRVGAQGADDLRPLPL